MSWLARISGLEGFAVEKRRAALPILEIQAHDFLAAGGALTPELWASLETDERAAFVSAGDRLAAERSLLLADALRGRTAEHARLIGGERARTRQVLVAEAVTGE